jgi:hypothetical protein
MCDDAPCAKGSALKRVPLLRGNQDARGPCDNHGQRLPIQIDALHAADRERWQRWWRIGTARRSMSGGRGSLWRRAEGCGTAEKPCVWRWQERFMREGVAGLLCEKTRRPGLPPLPPALVERVVGLTLTEPPGEATHWTGRAMATAAITTARRRGAGLPPPSSSSRTTHRLGRWTDQNGPVTTARPCPALFLITFFRG